VSVEQVGEQMVGRDPQRCKGRLDASLGAATGPYFGCLESGIDDLNENQNHLSRCLLTQCAKVRCVQLVSVGRERSAAALSGPVA
jgi:hypothetical protein